MTSTQLLRVDGAVRTWKMTEKNEKKKKKKMLYLRSPTSSCKSSWAGATQSVQR
jgi:hypothetical protein